VLVTPHIVDPVHTQMATPEVAQPPIPYINNPSFDTSLPGIVKKSQTPPSSK
jgi:hypothetical protein